METNMTEFWQGLVLDPRRRALLNSGAIIEMICVCDNILYTSILSGRPCPLDPFGSGRQVQLEAPLAAPVSDYGCAAAGLQK
jgi:hypothetical protein